MPPKSVTRQPAFANMAPVGRQAVGTSDDPGGVLPSGDGEQTWRINFNNTIRVALFTASSRCLYKAYLSTGI
jgi:hypothetical protein